MEKKFYSQTRQLIMARRKWGSFKLFSTARTSQVLIKVATLAKKKKKYKIKFTQF